MFRIRLDGDPSRGGQFVRTALLDTDTDPDVDWAFQLDLSGDNQVELVQALSGGPETSWEVALAGPPSQHRLRQRRVLAVLERLGDIGPSVHGLALPRAETGG